MFTATVQRCGQETKLENWVGELQPVGQIQLAFVPLRAKKSFYIFSKVKSRILFHDT